jgi:hypothetical protein
MTLPVVAGFALACGLVGAAGWTRRRHLTVALSAMTLLGMLGGAASMTRMVGPIYHYLVA